MSLDSRLGEPLRAAERLFAEAEGQCALIFRCRPLNHRAEYARVLGAWRTGQRCAPSWQYASPPSLASLRGRLERAARELQRLGRIGQLYAERAAELDLEARLAESVNRPGFVELARERFASDSASAQAGEALAEAWLAEAGAVPKPLISSDDASDTRSLLRQMQRLVALTALPFRVQISEDLVAVAATGDQVFWVGAARLLSENDGLRIAVHEVFGHGLPQQRARVQALGLFSVASARGLDEQEGYAVLCEERAGLLDARRKRELAARHVAALLVHAGADWVDTCQSLLERGVLLEQAVATTLRVYRGGGLARERAYLPAFHRVRQNLGRRPELEPWLGSGRLSTSAAEVLRGEVTLAPWKAGSFGERGSRDLERELRVLGAQPTGSSRSTTTGT